MTIITCFGFVKRLTQCSSFSAWLLALRCSTPVLGSLLIFVLLTLSLDRVAAQPFAEQFYVRNPWQNLIGSQLLPFDSSLFYTPDRFDLEFAHQLTLYQWASTLQFTQNNPDVVRYRLLLDARSRFREGTGLRTNEAGASMYIGQALSNSIAIFGKGALTTYSSLGGQANILTSFGNLNQVANGYGLAGLELSPEEHISASVGAGYARESQNGSKPHGYLLKGDAGLAPIMIFDEQWLSGSAAFDERRYPDQNKVYRNDGITLSLQSIFDQFTSNRLTASFNELRRDLSFVSNGSPLLQRRSEGRIQMLEELSYPLIRQSLQSDLTLEFEDRSVNRRTNAPLSQTPLLPILTAPENIRTQRILGHIRLQTLRELFGFSAELSLRYEERSEDFSLIESEVASLSQLQRTKLAQTLDESSSNSRQTLLALLIGRSLSESDKLSAQSTLRLLRYDTPSPENVDDRDELLTNALLRYEHKFSNAAQNTTELRMGRSHTVYLRAERSAQNSVTQSLSLNNQSVLRWTGSRHALRAEVFANFTTLDYENILPLASTLSSYVVRGLQVNDSSDFHLGSFFTRPLWLDLSGTWNIFEQGSYDAGRFSEFRLALNQELGMSAAFRLMTSIGEISAGIKGFWLDRVTYGTQAGVALSDLHARQSRLGPTGSVLLQSSNRRFNVVGAIWIARVTGVNALLSEISTESHLSMRIIF